MTTNKDQFVGGDDYGDDYGEDIHDDTDHQVGGCAQNAEHLQLTMGNRAATSTCLEQQTKRAINPQRKDGKLCAQLQIEISMPPYFLLF